MHFDLLGKSWFPNYEKALICTNFLKQIHILWTTPTLSKCPRSYWTKKIYIIVWQIWAILPIVRWIGRGQKKKHQMNLALTCYTHHHWQSKSKKYFSLVKGQLISEWHFDVLNFPKKRRKNLTNFCSRI